ncbi:hypothetical protein HDU76_000460 [Blyttiomyces sp. JEL0837]|nr:hypothetical protein HDU76_000460 [Blyttiomyces sp. JEL0837]
MASSSASLVTGLTAEAEKLTDDALKNIKIKESGTDIELEDIPSVVPHNDGDHANIAQTLNANSQKSILQKILEGPTPLRPPSLRSLPYFGKLDRRINRLVVKIPFLVRVFLWMVFMSGWIAGFASLVKQSLFGSWTSVGSPQYIDPTSAFYDRNDACGLDAINCATSPGDTFAFRCPGSVLNTILLNPRAVGDEEVVYVPFVVGGGLNVTDSTQSGTYRSDSFLCASAIHAGKISPESGGCAAIQFTNFASDFTSSRQNGVSSIPFPSTFPSGFQFLDVETKNCVDIRWKIVGFNVAMSVIFVLVFSGSWLDINAGKRETGVVTPVDGWIDKTIRKHFYNHDDLLITMPNESKAICGSDWKAGHTSAAIMYWILACLSWWQISLASNTRKPIPPVSSIFADFLPTLFVFYGLWKITFRYILPPLNAMPIQRTLLLLPGFWIGTLYNDVIANNVPIDRLTTDSLSKRPGATTSVIVICVIIFILALLQCYFIWRSGKLLKFLFGYGLTFIIIGILISVTGLQFRFHHYFIGMCILPLASVENHLSVLVCFLMLGIMMDGIARFGFASILQTKQELLRDGALGTDIPVFEMDNYNVTVKNVSAVVSTLAMQGFRNVSVRWKAISVDLAQSWNGFSLIVDDVLRYVGTDTSYNFTLVPAQHFDAVNSQQQVAAGGQPAPLPQYLSSVPHFFRIAYQVYGTAGDFSQAGTLTVNGDGWIPNAPGPS